MIFRQRFDATSSMTADFEPLPGGLPVPRDDGAAKHLTGLILPRVSFRATNGRSVDIGSIAGRSVIYIYSMTGRPGVSLPGGWASTPGARGCTPQACSFRDHHAELRSLGAFVFGLSSQSTEYQQEAKERLHLPFELLSDPALELKALLSLPTFQAQQIELYKLMTLIADDGRIEKVFYSVFPADRNIDEVLSWLRRKR
ncbi:MAG: peroxiredoxin [Gammaproteobacteria bacterium]